MRGAQALGKQLAGKGPEWHAVRDRQLEPLQGFSATFVELIMVGLTSRGSHVCSFRDYLIHLPGDD